MYLDPPCPSHKGGVSRSYRERLAIRMGERARWLWWGYHSRSEGRGNGWQEVGGLKGDSDGSLSCLISRRQGCTMYNIAMVALGYCAHVERVLMMLGEGT